MKPGMGYSRTERLEYAREYLRSEHGQRIVDDASADGRIDSDICEIANEWDLSRGDVYKLIAEELEA